MSDTDDGSTAIGPSGLNAPRHVVPLPALPQKDRDNRLVYSAPAMNSNEAFWYPVSRFASSARWHRARVALARGNIVSLMGEGEDVGPNEDPNSSGIVLNV